LLHRNLQPLAFCGDPEETRHPQRAWHALATVANRWNLSDDGDATADGGTRTTTTKERQ
jgi:hypothetical protein